jgi:uncharacterized OB-fold protein
MQGHDQQAVAVVEGLFEERSDGVVLLASRCAQCTRRYFPRTETCRDPSCGRAALSGTELSGAGTLWSYTVQHYPAPEPFRFDGDPPYGIGVIEFDDGLRVVAMVVPEAVESLRPGDKVSLTGLTLYTDDAGQAVRTWALTTAGQAGGTQ